MGFLALILWLVGAYFEFVGAYFLVRWHLLFGLFALIFWFVGANAMMGACEGFSLCTPSPGRVPADAGPGGARAVTGPGPWKKQ